jgi:hypothetical protein
MLLGDIVNLGDTESFLVRRIIIVPPNIEEEVINEELGYDEDGKEIRHAVPLNKYIKDKNLEIDGFKNPPAYFSSEYLSSLGYLIINVDEEVCTYMPEKIMERQRDWCKTNSEYFKSSNFSISVYERGMTEIYDTYRFPNKDIYEMFMLLLDEKLICDNNKRIGR